MRQHDSAHRPRFAAAIAGLAHAHLLAVFLYPVAVLARYVGAPAPLDCAAGAFMVLTAVAGPLHARDEALCVPCAKAIPLDAPARAVKLLPVLRVRHFWTAPRGLLTFITLIAIGVLWPAPTSWGGAALALGTTAMLASDWYHRLFAPWCPLCRHGGGDDGGDDCGCDPTPDPTGATRDEDRAILVTQ